MITDFVEFLRSEKIVTDDQLATALCRQVSAMPAYSDVAFRNGLLSGELVVNALLLQVRERCGFKTACEKLGVWNADLEQKLTEHIHNGANSLFALLVEQGALTEAALAEALARWRSRSGSGVGSGAQRNPPLRAPGRLKEFMHDGAEVSLAITRAMNAAVEQGNWIEARQECDKMFHLMHRLKGAATFLEAEDLAAQADRAERTFARIMAFDPTSWSPELARQAVVLASALGECLRQLISVGEADFPQSKLLDLEACLNGLAKTEDQ
ncbi:MAG: hypothetical protein HC902_11155 [Calothrix sp. SM1_5_4]|nr:hypothetical protein [Calothrix sp. SM1_5_4]